MRSTSDQTIQFAKRTIVRYNPYQIFVVLVLRFQCFYIIAIIPYTVNTFQFTSGISMRDWLVRHRYR